MARVGLLGGTFNPIHLAHLVVAEEVREEAGLREVFLVPARNPPHKEGETIPEAELRLEMVRLAAEGNAHLRAADLELRREGPSYTVDTVQAFRQELEPDAEIFLIVGADGILELMSWKNPEELLRICSILVPTRPGFDLALLPARIAERVRIVPVTALAISSREVRERVRQGRSIRYLVPDPVRQFIEARGLYRG